MKRTYRLLSIDAWVSGGCGECETCQLEDDGEGMCEDASWTWNDWHYMQTLDAVPETVEQFAALIYQNVTPELLKTLDIDDDQYNVVLINKADGEPLYAVEYGNEITESEGE